MWGICKLFGQLTLTALLAMAAAFTFGVGATVLYVVYEALTKWNH